jgi:two-component system, NarL family, response regulator DegU
MKFLIVDDNAKMREIIRITLCNEEDSVLECSDGNEALKMYSDNMPDLVLMDIQMKAMNGMLASAKILDSYPDSKIIILTDHDTPTFRMAAKDIGVLAFFSKEDLFKVKDFINSFNNKQMLNKGINYA